MTPTGRRILLSRLIFITVAAAMCFIFMAFPRCQDDFWFISDINRLGTDADGRFSLLRGIGGCIAEHYRTDNGRLGNTIAILLIYLPRPVGAVLCCIAFTGMYMLMARLGGVGRSQPARLIVLSTLMLLWHPWSRYIFSIMYCFNYVWSSLLVLVCVMLALRHKPCNAVIAFVAGLIAGSWHEAAAVAILSGSVAVAVMCPAMRRRQLVCIAAGALAGLCLNLAAPGPWYRITHEPPRADVAYVQFKYITGCIIYILLWLTMLCRRRLRCAAMSPIAVWAFAAVVSLTAVAYLTVHANAAWTACSLAVCATCAMLWQVWPRFGFSRVSVVITVLLGTFTVANLTATAVTTVRLSSRMNALTRMADSLAHDVADGDTMFIYTPVIHTWQYPAVALQRPMPDMFANDEDNMYIFRQYYDRRIVPVVLPEPLRRYRSGMGKPLGGGAGYSLYDGNLVGPPSPCPGWHAVVSTYKTLNHEEWSPGFVTNFTGADGKRYSYLEVHRSTLGNLLGEPVAIRLP